MEEEGTANLSEDSLASLTAEDVLIGSTSIHMKKKPLDAQTGAPADSKGAPCGRKKVSISVKKLREVPPPHLPGTLTLTKDGTAYIPPALLGNKPMFHKASTSTSAGDVQGDLNQSTDRYSEQLPSPEKDGQPSQVPSEAYSQEPAGNVPSQVREDSSKQKGADIFISQYDAGQKEAVRAVFKQRIQNAPVFKEVKVQLLDHACPDKKDSTRSTQSEVDSVTTIAAATAAAIASTAPLLKVQSDLEAKVSSVSEVLNKLHETDRRLQRVVEQRHLEGPPCHPKACQLDKQMNLFMEQRIRHLETLQQQQMNIQSHLISSALNSGGVKTVSTASSTEPTKHAMKAGRSLGSQTSPPQKDLFPSSATHAEASSRHFGSHGVPMQKSPLKTPAPRKYAPVPVAKDVKISQNLSKREQPIGEKENICQPPCGGILGGGNLLEQILNSQETLLSGETSSRKEPANNNAVPRNFGRQYRSSLFQTEPFHTFENTNQNLNPVERTVQKADEVLRDLGQLKREMCGILQDAKEWKSDMNSFIKTTSHVRKPAQVEDCLPPSLPAHPLRSSSDALNHVPSKTEKDPAAPSLSELQQLSKSSVLKSTKASRSILREAEKILRAVRKNKKLLEENLEAIIRAKDGNALHAFIDELTADRDVLEEIRIRKTVDEWIKAISLEIQDEIAREDWLKTHPVTKTVKPSREPNGRPPYSLGIPTRRLLPAARSPRKLTDKGPLKKRTEVQKEDCLSQVYGRPIYQGHRSTLKKSPYLRFSSPPPKSKPPRPKLIESVRGTKVKSTRTQTGPSVCPEKPPTGSAPHQELQYLFSPIKETSSAFGPLEGHLIPMAIPLGQKRISSLSPPPGGRSLGEFHPVTVTVSLPPPPPPPQKPQPKITKPNIAVIEMKSEKKDPPQLTVQVLPSVDIDSVSSDSAASNHIPLAPFPPTTMLQASPEESLLQDDEALKLPGADFVDVTDVAQSQEDDDGIPDFSEPVLEFNRQQERESPKYNGPPFPPAAPAPQLSADILDEIIEKRETLENKLIGWVEQEVMARIISEMYPTQKEAVPDRSLSESEESQAASSDIVEAAGASGFQLFVDAGVPVDSEMIRHFVNEALAETIAIMLGDREGQKAAPPATALPSTMPEKETTVSTPVVTPEATPPQSPPPLKEPLGVKTPESSLSANEMDGGTDEQQLTAAGGSQAAVVRPVATPLATPAATPPRAATPSSALSEQPPSARPKPPDAWGDAELPLDEEKPSPQSEEGGYNPKAVIMSVAKHEEPDSLVWPASGMTEPHDLQPQEPPKAPSLSVHTPSSAPSTEESSLSTTETETADRPISEGEVLYSYGQLLAAKAFAEGELCLPHISDSLASSLRDVREMDYDPPSEGQVLHRPHRGYHRDPVLSLFSKLNPAPLASQEEICGSEYTDNSAGELSEGQRPKLTKAAESILLGRSVYMGQAADPTSRRPTQRTASPGQCDGDAGEVLGDADVSCGPMSMAELDQPVSPTAYEESKPASHPGNTTLKKHQETLQAGPVKSRVICVKPKSEVAEQQDFPRDTDRTQIEPSMYLTSLLSGGEAKPHLRSLPAPAKMSVKVPSADIDDEIQSFSSFHGSSGSSGADTL
ncbi:protein TALPID3 isoform X2 [Pogona vitticeps]